MSFIEHLEALRWHILRSLVAIVAVGIVVFLAKDFVFDTIIFGPKELDFISYRLLCQAATWLQMENLCIEKISFTVVNLDMAGQFLTHIKVSFILGLIVAFPYVFWEFWRFISPALYDNERQHARGLVAICSFLFLFGVAFGYYIITPFSVNFLGAYRVSETVESTINLGSYINVIAMIALATGIIFELPVAAYLLSKLGLLTPDMMRQYRKHAFIITLFVSAVITPPDIASQVITSIPILILYEISIHISARVQRKLEEALR